MEQKSTHHTSSADIDWGPGTWMLAIGIIVVAVVVALASLAITSMNQQNQQATGPQTTPAPR